MISSPTTGPDKEEEFLPKPECEGGGCVTTLTGIGSSVSNFDLGCAGNDRAAVQPYDQALYSEKETVKTRNTAKRDMKTAMTGNPRRCQQEYNLEARKDIKEVKRKEEEAQRMMRKRKF